MMTSRQRKGVRIEDDAGGGLEGDASRPGLEGSSSGRLPGVTRALEGSTLGLGQTRSSDLEGSTSCPISSGTTGSGGNVSSSGSSSSSDGPHPGQSANLGLDAPMSARKLEVLPASGRMVRRAFHQQGEPARESGVHDVSLLCVGVSACNVAEIYTPPRLTAWCNDLGHTSAASITW